MVQREPHLRDRRRGRLDPGRRGAHAAHHLRAVGALGRALLRGRPHHPEARQGRGDQGQVRQQDDDRRLPPRREGAHLALTEEGVAKAEKLLGVPNLYDPSNIETLHAVQQALRAHTLYQRRPRLHRQGRPGDHRRRVHRPPDAGPALVGRAAPGGRGQGGRQDRGREPDPGHDHPAELLPHVREARRHDRHRGDRGRRVRPHLRPRRRGDPDQPRR